MKRCRDADASRPVLNVVGKRGAQPQIVECGWTKLPDELVDVVIQSFGDLFDGINQRAVRFQMSARILQHANPQRKRGELLTKLIVHFSSDAPALVLLREDETSEEFAARAFRLGALPRRQIEVGSDNADDRTTGCTANGISPRQDFDVMSLLVPQ